MFDRGIYNERVMMAAKVHEALEKSRAENLFKNLLEGKKVAVVGNAPSEIGRKKVLKLMRMIWLSDSTIIV